MLLITNISITDEAAPLLRKAKATYRPGTENVFALVYTSSFTNADGSTVDGFRPGYTAMSWGLKYVGKNWILARLPDGIEFYFFPRFKWSARARYAVGLTGSADAPFSIEVKTAN